MTKWQPIETAPKDGRDIICYFPSNSVHKILTVRWDKTIEMWRVSKGSTRIYVYASHWHQLPPEPVSFI